MSLNVLRVLLGAVERALAANGKQEATREDEQEGEQSTSARPQVRAFFVRLPRHASQRGTNNTLFLLYCMVVLVTKCKLAHKFSTP